MFLYLNIIFTKVFLKQFIYILIIFCIAFTYGCKAKKCPNFEGDGAKHHVKYDKDGLVKKKGSTSQRTWDTY